MVSGKRVLFVAVCLIVVSAVFPTGAYAHAKDGTLTGTYVAKVERWRPTVAKQLKRYGVYTKEREGRVLNIIRHESGGNPLATNGRCIGLLQFDLNWGPRSVLLNGERSITKLASAWKRGGTSNIKKHWKATYDK